ncbi:CAAD domain-containing protein [Cyanobium gracile UHCC 0139]|uniref:CAAD domain-containing protein n=1 Tax=Cyanobium gracile UHCC 0139 TaxID=3110308 RepID=A0ABU5RTK1_9CYAN|nr:CAAD domain-containing protein [Cyanobium gracile]MEA5391124.1 CAAD domain-containing protein [Cyanobium gracile UHCC 0139]
MAETPFSPEPPSSPEPQENGPSAQPWETEPAVTMPDATTPESEHPAPEPFDVAPEPEPEPISAGFEPLAEADSEIPAPVPTPGSEPEPGITATLEVPPLEGSAETDGEGGGEFELLLQKIKDWLGSGELQAQWQRFRGPLKGLAILIGVVLLLRVYASLIGTLDSLPLVGGLLELVGLIAALRFTATRLVRKSDRDQVFADWSRRWNDFRGRE